MNCNMEDLIKKKRVLFITTKNVDYIRNVQEIRLLQDNAVFLSEIYSNKKSYIKRIIDVWQQVLKCNVNDFDVTFIGFSPQLILPLFYKKFQKQIIVIDFFISVYDTLINDRNKFKTGGLISKVCHLIDAETLKKADHVIVDTKADMKYFAEEFRIYENKFETLYMKADSSIYYPREQKKRIDLQNRFVVLYFGSILPLQGIDVILEAVKLLSDRQEIHFQIIGAIPDKYSKPIQGNVEYIDWLSQEELARHIANADLCLAGHFNGKIDKGKRTIPGKAYIYEAMEKKMILGDNSANHELFSEDKKHRFVEMGNAQKLSSLIMQLYMEDR